MNLNDLESLSNKRNSRSSSVSSTGRKTVTKKVFVDEVDYSDRNSRNVISETASKQRWRDKSGFETIDEMIVEAESEATKYDIEHKPLKFQMAVLRADNITTYDNLTLSSLQKSTGPKEIQESDIVIETNENLEMIEEKNEKAENDNEKPKTDSDEYNQNQHSNEEMIETSSEDREDSLKN